MRLSVIIPTYNRRAQLARVLSAFERQTTPSSEFELVVVSDGSRDGTNEDLLAARPPFALTPVLQENQGVAAARNAGVGRASADWILFVDDDVVPAPQLIAEHLSTLEQDQQAIVLGPMMTPADIRLAPWVRWEQRMLEKQYDSMIQGRWTPTARQFYTGNTSLVKSHILKAGGFDPAFRRAEDVELAYRLKDMGLRFVFNPRAVGYHYADRSFNSWTQIAYAYGRNDVIITRQKGQTWLLPTIFKEFGQRHPMIQALTRLCLGRPRLSQGVIAGLNQSARLGDLLKLEALPRFAYSGIFNLRHYQGIADELGSAAQFWRALADNATK